MGVRRKAVGCAGRSAATGATVDPLLKIAEFGMSVEAISMPAARASLRYARFDVSRVPELCNILVTIER